MSPEQIQSALEQAFPEARVLVRDLTGTGDHYQAVVGARDFEGKPLIEQHKMVYAALGPAVGADIHALMLRTCTPEAFDDVAASADPGRSQG